ncbi:MAG: carbohydrate binding domain-containing protein, partial [Maribacter sp.]
MIKNYTKLLLAVFFLICFTGFSQTNLISNGDFENWTGNQLDDWTFNNRAPIRVQNDFSSGSNSIEMWNISSSPISMSIVNQNTNLEAGKLYVIIIDSKTTTSGGTGNSKGYSYNLKINNGVATSPLIERQEWETSQQTFTAIGNGSDIIELSINSYSGGMLNVLIDNIRIFDVEQLNQNTSDKAALIAFHNSTGGPNWKNTWDINSDMNFWYGIKVDLAGRVTEINLKSNNLQGTLPAELGNLTELKKLELNRDFQYLEEVNNLNGAIPSTFQNLKKLEVLNLSNSGLTGSIPSEIGEMTALKELILSLNNFSGTIPPSLGNLSNLKNFNANYTTLSGNIPSELGLLTNLENLNLTGNQLSGSIPSSLGQLINLKELALSGNELTGAIPTSLNQLAQLEKLILAQNELSSTISESISQLSNLKELNLSSNNLVGPIPVQLSQLSQLESLYLDRNNLTGNIPKELGLLINLQRLSLVDINLTGTIPPELANLTNLERLYLGSNNLDGEIPSNFSQLTNLIEFSLYFNNLSGTVPSVSNNNIYYGLQANNFVFEDFPSNTNNQASTRYSPQSKVGEISITTLVEGGTFNLEVTETTHDNNTNQWRKDGVDISGAISSNLTIENIKPTDAGDYDCIIKNTLLTELTLEKEPITLNVLSNDDDNDGVINSNDQCPNTPSGNTVDSQGCIVSNNNQVNYAQNFSFENWSTNPATPEDWTIENENSIIQSTDATDGSSSLELDLDNSLQFKTELINTTSIQLATNTTYTYAFDYKIKRGTDVSAEIHISKDGNPYGIPLLREYTTFNTDGNWHTFSFDFDTNATDESHIFRLIFRANTTET